MKIREKDKQIKATRNQGEIKTIKKYTYDNQSQVNPLFSKQKELFNELADKRLNKINELNEKVNSDDLIYRYKGNTADAKFDQFDNAFSMLDKIRDGIIRLAKMIKQNLNQI